MNNPPPNQNLNSTFPPGYKFHPTEGELITYYLSRKISNIPLPVDVIPLISLYDYEPWQLPALSKFNWSEKEWLFFNLVSSHKKGWSIESSKKVNRETPKGQWKSGGKKQAIVVGGEIVGWKKNMTFYAGTVRDRKKTNWYMKEYRSIKDDYPKGALLVISKVYVKITPAQLQLEPTLVHKIVANEGDDSAQDVFLDMALEKEASLDGEQDLYSKKLEQVSTMAIPKVGQSILNNETSSSKPSTSSWCLSLPGFWFCPTDSELIEYYLMRKVLNLPIHDDAISEIDLFKWAPWDLPSQSRLKHRNMEWYFFNFHDRKHTHSCSYFNGNCQVVKGYWMPSDTDMPVRSTSTNAVIGMKRTFIFHLEKSPYGKKTDWLMYEYRLKEDDQIGPLCVVSKIWKISSTRKKLTACEMHEKEVVAQVDKSMCALISNLDAAMGDNILLSSTDTEQGTRTLFMVGSEAEVAYTHENVPVAWYTATVTEIISEKVLAVEYLSLRNEDGSSLRRTVSIQNIRPRPPSTLEVRYFQLLDIVEAFYNGGWWEGVVAAVKDHSKYNVKLLLLEDEIVFSNTELRVLYDWIDEEWILASQDKSLKSQNNVESLHASSPPLRKRKDPDPVSTSTDNVDISCLLPSFEQNKNNRESRRPFLGSKKGRKSETAEDTTKLSDSRGAGTSSNVLKLGLEVPTLICEEQQRNIHINVMIEKANKDCQQIGEVPEFNQDGVQDEAMEQQNNAESLHGCSYVPKCKDPDRVATSMNNINIPCLLLPSLPQKKNDEELTRLFTRTMRIVNVRGKFMSFTRPMRINLWCFKTMLNHCIHAVLCVNTRISV